MLRGISREQRDFNALGWSTECCIIHFTIIVHRYQDRITTPATFPEVVGLKIECSFRESITVSNVMNNIYRVECSSACRVGVLPFRGVPADVVEIFELMSSLGRLFRSLISPASERDDVVPAAIPGRYEFHLAQWK